MLETLACFYALTMLYFVLAFPLDWLRSYRLIRKYLVYGIALGVAFVALELLALSIAPTGRTVTPLRCVFICSRDFLKMAAITMLGMHYCFLLGRPSFPLLLRRFGVAQSGDADVPEPVSSEALPPVSEGPPDVLETSDGLSADQIISNDGLIVATDAIPPVPEVSWRYVVGGALAVTAVSLVYSLGLILLVSPRTSEAARKAFGVSSVHTSIPQFLGYVLSFAVGEEILFRLGIQSYLARYLKWNDNRYWMAILSATTLWTIAHVGSVEPYWFKPAQVFLMGLLLGWLCQRYGVESSILAHMLFSVAGPLSCALLLNR